MIRLFAIVLLFAVATLVAPVSARGQDSFTESERVSQLFRDAGYIGFDKPVDLIRVVNELRSIGKSRAIETLQSHARKAFTNARFVESTDEVGDEFDVVASEQASCLIIPLLFKPLDTERHPPPAPWFDHEHGQWESWSHAIVLENDLPFNLLAGFTLGGHFPPTRPLVNWAERHGVLREDPLRPADNPLAAADMLIQKLTTSAGAGRMHVTVSGETNAEYQSRVKVQLRRQAVNAISATVGEAHDLTRTQLRRAIEHDDSWLALKRSIARAGVFWSEELQSYVLPYQAKHIESKQWR